MIDPALEPPPTHDVAPTPGLWRNGAFVRVWTAATVSVFGSFVTRMALPFVAILVLQAGPLQVAAVRASELVAALLVGFVAGAWVDRLRRRPVLIWADIARAMLLASIPVAFVGGWLTLAQVILVAALAAVCTTFFDVADRAYLPSIVERDELLRANGALSATSAAVEFAGFGIAGFLVTALSAPIAILIDAVTFLVSAVVLGTIRRPEPPPPPVADREPVRREIVTGYRVVADDPVLRALALGAMSLTGMWGVVGATWLLFATDILGLEPAAIGLIAAIGGIGALAGALATPRVTRRLGVGRVTTGGLVIAGLAVLLLPLAPAGAPLLAAAFLLGQQLIGDSAITAFEITEVSVRQARVPDRQLGRVNATVNVGMALAQLAGTILAGVIAELIGLRAALVLAPIWILLGAAVVWLSPVRSLRSIDPEPASRSASA